MEGLPQRHPQPHAATAAAARGRARDCPSSSPPAATAWSMPACPALAGAAGLGRPTVVAPYERSPQIGVRYWAAAVARAASTRWPSEFNRFTLPGATPHATAAAAASACTCWAAWPALCAKPGWFDGAARRASTPRPTARCSGIPRRQRRHHDTRRARPGDTHASASTPASSSSASTTWPSAARCGRPWSRACSTCSTPYRAEPAAQLRRGGQGLQLQLDLHRQPVRGRRPGVRRAPADGRRHHPLRRQPPPAPRPCAWAWCSAYLFRTQRVTAAGRWLARRRADRDRALVRRAAAGFDQRAARLERWTPPCNTAPTCIVRCAPSSACAIRPGPLRTISTAYRLTRGLSEQLELGWQWPVWSSQQPAATRRQRNSQCLQRHLVRVGRVNYSLRDSRITDSVLGVPSTTPAAGSAAWWPSGCPPGAAKPPRG